MRPELTCDDIDRDDLIVRYVSGQLAAEDAERIERHYLGCPRCAEELQLASDVRRATEPDARRTVSSTAFWRVALPAAAAAILVLSIVIWRQSGANSSVDVVRGASGTMQMTA